MNLYHITKTHFFPVLFVLITNLYQTNAIASGGAVDGDGGTSEVLLAVDHDIDSLQLEIRDLLVYAFKNISNEDAYNPNQPFSYIGTKQQRIDEGWLLTLLSFPIYKRLSPYDSIPTYYLAFGQMLYSKVYAPMKDTEQVGPEIAHGVIELVQSKEKLTIDFSRSKCELVGQRHNAVILPNYGIGYDVCVDRSWMRSLPKRLLRIQVMALLTHELAHIYFNKINTDKELLPKMLHSYFINNWNIVLGAKNYLDTIVNNQSFVLEYEGDVNEVVLTKNRQVSSYFMIFKKILALSIVHCEQIAPFDDNSYVLKNKLDIQIGENTQKSFCEESLTTHSSIFICSKPEFDRVRVLNTLTGDILYKIETNTEPFNTLQECAPWAERALYSSSFDWSIYSAYDQYFHKVKKHNEFMKAMRPFLKKE